MRKMDTVIVEIGDYINDNNLIDYMNSGYVIVHKFLIKKETLPDKYYYEIILQKTLDNCD